MSTLYIQVHYVYTITIYGGLKVYSVYYVYMGVPWLHPFCTQ